MYNNAYILIHLNDSLQHREQAPPKEKTYTGSAFLAREAGQLAPRAFIKQLRRSPSPTSPDPVEDESEIQQSPQSPGEYSEEENGSPRRARTLSLSSMWSTISKAGPASRNSTLKRKDRPWKVEPFEILRAVERRDVTFLMEVRERDFELLLRKTGDATPLLHAMRIGHQDIAIILLGAFSRYINNLQDDEMALPRTKTRLKALREYWVPFVSHSLLTVPLQA
ncbi:hypothetical protein EIP86_007031 [Pleurotus ostreatoroseus]|nr:hypothetical protein EIP86_007031 [Pleurotus ostreatoroseus]